MSFIQHFKENYYQKLLTPNGNNPVRNRADSLLKVFELLESKYSADDIINIVESGCSRPDHGHLCFGDDGSSTIIFNDFVRQCNNNSRFHSVDISAENCQYAKAYTDPTFTKIHCGDSVTFLASLPPTFKINLLYLDSWDVLKENPLPAQHHALMELAASMNKLIPGSIVLVDDFRGFFDNGETGKGWLVKQFMEKIDAELIIDGYQLGYIIK